MTSQPRPEVTPRERFQAAARSAVRFLDDDELWALAYVIEKYTARKPGFRSSEKMCNDDRKFLRKIGIKP